MRTVLGMVLLVAGAVVLDAYLFGGQYSRAAMRVASQIALHF
ncbi:MAG TPA: hypothetical protein VFQ27_13655 [Xanthobacteraceae bacterium]|nr:hypothetical protein [Xanthobacteraceae bacterium]